MMKPLSALVMIGLALTLAGCGDPNGQYRPSPTHAVTFCEPGVGCHSVGGDGTDLNAYDNSSP